MSPERHILITCIAEKQSYNTGLDFARLLTEMGHHVTFVGQRSAAQQKYVEANGFEYQEIVPPLQGTAKGGLIQRVKSLRSMSRELTRSAEEFARQHAKCFDAAFMDVNARVAAPVLAKAGIPTIAFCSGYTSTFSLRYPPANWCRRVPASPDGTGWAERLANLFWWTHAILRRGVLRFLGNPMALVAAWSLGRLPRKYGWRYCFGEWGLRPRVPEIAFAYKAIDWPVQQKSATRLYLDRRHPRTETVGKDWRRGVDVAKPLVYCSLGAMPGPGVWKDRDRKILAPAWQPLMAYLEVVAAAFATRPDWQLVLAPGHLADGFDADALPPNVRLCRWVPQDEVLGQAAAAITAGGSATLRDCVRFGVPMLVFPAWADHFGNAARVAFHKLGYDGGELRKLTPPRLVALVDALLRDQEIASAVSKAQKSCDESLEVQVQDLRRFVERHTSIRL